MAQGSEAGQGSIPVCGGGQAVGLCQSALPWIGLEWRGRVEPGCCSGGKSIDVLESGRSSYFARSAPLLLINMRVLFVVVKAYNYLYFLGSDKIVACLANNY